MITVPVIRHGSASQMVLALGAHVRSGIAALRFYAARFWPFRHIRAESAAKESKQNQCIAREWLSSCINILEFL
jgi:hypothetical protein